MNTDMIYSSPLERAVQTGEIVTGLQRDRNGRNKFQNGSPSTRAWIWYA